MEYPKLYHIHRIGNLDYQWYVDNQMIIDDNFNALFYTELLEIEKVLIERYKNYDIDYIIAMMEEIKNKNYCEDDLKTNFNSLLTKYYFLRREFALEEGRKIFNPSAPSRFHTIFLTNLIDMHYWIKQVGDNYFKTFLLELNGNLFVSSDSLFPDNKLAFNIQVEKSKDYWNPNIRKRTLHKEYMFQGEMKILK